MESLPQTEKMLTAASKDIDHRHRTASTNSESYYYDPVSTLSSSNEHNQDQELKNFNSSTCPTPRSEDDSENEEETNSEQKSAASVINLKYLKSIESSTDTLVAESIVTPDPPFSPSNNSMSYSYSSAVVGNGSGMHKFEMDVHHKTERDQVEAGVRADILLRKTEPERRVYNPTLQSKEGEENSFTGKRIARESIETNSKDLLAALANLPQSGPDLDQIIGIPQQCEVCATSRKLLQDDVPLSTHSNALNTSNSSTITAQSTNNITTSTTGSVAMPPPSSTSTSTSSTLYPVGNGVSNGTKNGVTPNHSRTHSTSAGFPYGVVNSTSEEQEQGSSGSIKQLGPRGERFLPTNIGTLTKPYFDVDGLEPLHDEVQSRLNVIISGYRVSLHDIFGCCVCCKG